MKIMLCGSADTGSIYPSFEKIVNDFGVKPVSFLKGSHIYENSLTSSSESNSRASIQDANICIFVINQKFGRITWNVEFEEALREGKPFIILCEKDTLGTYRSLRRVNGASPEFQEIYDLLEMIEQKRDLTIIEYSFTSFESELRDQLGMLFEKTVKDYTVHKQREIASYLLHTDAKLSERDIEDLKAVLVDEYENKKVRKDILQRLANLHCLDKETVLDLICSAEQGVSRMTVEYLDKLMRDDEYDLAFLKECVVAINNHDDTGTERRLVSKILEIDVKNGVLALQELNLVEIGAKRRLSSELIKHKDQIIAAGVTKEALELAKECHKKADNKGWRDECAALISELEAIDKQITNPLHK